MWIIRVEDLSTQRDRLLSDFLDDGGYVLKKYLKVARSKTRQEDIRIYEHYKWNSTEDIVEAKVWSTKEDAIKFYCQKLFLLVELLYLCNNELRKGII
jgi:enolase